MPWKSVEQARWGHSPAGLKALGGREAVSEWDAATPKGSLPEKVKKMKLIRHPGAMKLAAKKVAAPQKKSTSIPSQSGQN